MIKQRTPYNCGIASFANALQISYEQAQALFAPQSGILGTTAADTANALTQLGVHSSYATFPAFYAHLGRPGNPCDPEVVRECPAILTVQSRNGNGLHAVYWDGQQAHDPDPNYQQPRNLDDLVLLEAVSIACVFANKCQGLCAKSGAGHKGLSA